MSARLPPSISSKILNLRYNKPAKPVVNISETNKVLVISDTLVGAIHESPLRYPCGSAPKSLGAIVGLYKAAVSKRINTICNTQDNSIWQRNYYEIINRNNKSLDNMRQYVVENPRCWTDDPENPQHHRGNHELLLDLPF